MMTQTSATTPERHKAVTGAPGVYRSGPWGDGSYSYEVRHPVTHKYETVTRSNVSGALAVAKRRAREVSAQDFAPTRVGVRLSEVVARWRAAGHPATDPRKVLRRGTIDRYNEVIDLHVLPALGSVKVRELDTRKLGRWHAGLKRKDGAGLLAETTRDYVLAVLMAILDYAVEMGALTAAPAGPKRLSSTRRNGRKRILSADEESRLLDYMDGRPWLVDIVTVARAQALRLGEPLGLDWSDVDFAGNRIRIRHTLHKDGTLATGLPGTTKAWDEDTEWLPLVEDAREVLVRLSLAQGRPTDGPVFRNTYGERRQVKDVDRGFREAAAKAGLRDEGEPIVFHSLRHTSISRLANATAPALPLPAVQRFARHADLKNTLRYVHSTEQPDEAAIFSAAMRAA